MTRTLHFHVGLPKCGSSSLQSFFAANRDALKKHGVHYPKLSERSIGNATPFTRSFGTSERQDVFEHYNPGYDAQSARAAFLETLNDRTSDQMLFSSEGLNRYFMREGLGTMGEGFDAVIVHLFIRPRAAWLLSHYT